MALSQFRLRIAYAFTLAFAIGLTIVAAISLGYLWRVSSNRLDARLDRLASDVRANLQLELNETPDSSAKFVASEVIAEWPRNGGSFVVCDREGQVLATTDSLPATDIRSRDCNIAPSQESRQRGAGAEPSRVIVRDFRIAAPQKVGRATEYEFKVAAFGSTAGILADAEVLLAAIGIAVPLILLLSLSGGYFMARRALRPVTELEAAISTIAPTDLSRRLSVREPRDEIGTLASAFNALLARLDAAQSQNRKFLREAAHQIRTPLTLVLGEAAFELAAADSSTERMRESLSRINLAAERMRRRVDDLFLLAEAQSGEPVALDELVELDELILTSVDLMRPRATALGRALAIGAAQAISVRGNSSLLSEAMLELLENALRHGDATQAVAISVLMDGPAAVLEVRSGGNKFQLPAEPQAATQGLGLQIVRWVAEVHNAALTHRWENGTNVLRIAMMPVAL